MRRLGCADITKALRTVGNGGGGGTPEVMLKMLNSPNGF